MSWQTWGSQPSKPEQVKQIYALASAGCRAFCESSAGVFGHYAEARNFGGNKWPAEWRVSDNSDRAWGAVVWHPESGQWFFRNGWLSGKDLPLASFEQAVVCAVRMFQSTKTIENMADSLKKPLSAEELHALVTRGAKQHGEDDEPDHEVGDLQDVLKIALTLMTPEQREALHTHEETIRVINGGLDPEG